MLLVAVCYAVAYYGGVAVSQLVVPVQYVLLVFLVFLGGVFLSLEEAPELVYLVEFLHGSAAEESALYLLVGEVLVALQVYGVYLGLLLLVDVHVEYDVVLLCHVVALRDVYFRVLVAFLLEVFLCQGLGAC